MTDKVEYIIFDKRETLGTKFFRNIVFFVSFAFCVYISQDSKFWTFISGSIFLLVLFGAAKELFDKSTSPKFHKKEDIINYINNLPDFKPNDNA